MDMRRGNRVSLVFGILLILAGIGFFIFYNNPQLQGQIEAIWAWPLSFVVLGGFLFLLGLILGEPGMGIPAVIVSGLGGILYYQVQTGDWVSWLYMWALIPGFVGIGIILASIFEGRWSYIWRGLDLVLISAVLYMIFSSLFGGLKFFGPYGPAILMISLGIYVLIRGAVSSRKKQITP
jgi:hypothetical protein